MNLHAVHKALVEPAYLPKVQLELPLDAKIIHVAEQQGMIGLWYECEPGNPTETRTFFVVGTGHPIPSGTQYVGTCHCDPFVWHLYERVAS